MASAAQPQTTKVNTTGNKTLFGGATVDGNRNFMNYGSWFQTQDATPTTALISPLSVTTGTVANLVVPPNAFSLTIVALTNAVSISEVAGTTSLTQSFNLPAGQAITLNVARQNNVYLLGITGTSVVSFFFQTM